MTERMIERLGGLTDRRKFLRRGGAAAVGAAAVLTGATTHTARGSHYIGQSSVHGCSLCQSAGSCSYVCSWCWWGHCHQNVGGSSRHQTQCCEGYSNFPGCTGGCTSSLNCSFYGGQRPC